VSHFGVLGQGPNVAKWCSPSPVADDQIEERNHRDMDATETSGD